MEKSKTMIKIYGISELNHIGKLEYRHLMSVISTKRRNKINAYLNYIDKLRSLFAELLLRYVLKIEYGISGEQIIFKYNRFGKPELLNYPKIHFNLSHSERFVLCGVGDSAIGVDVESVHDINLGMAELLFSKQEYTAICLKPKDEQIKSFYHYWTLKESYIKAEGTGLSIPLDSFEFRISDECIGMYIMGKEDRKYNFKIYEIGPNYVASVCWGGNRSELQKAEPKIISMEQVISLSAQY